MTKEGILKLWKEYEQPPEADMEESDKDYEEIESAIKMGFLSRILEEYQARLRKKICFLCDQGYKLDSIPNTSVPSAPNQWRHAILGGDGKVHGYQECIASKMLSVPMIED